MSTDVNSTLAALAIMPIMPVTVLASVHLIPQVKANFEQHMLDDWWMAKKITKVSCRPHVHRMQNQPLMVSSSCPQGGVRV